MAALATVFGLDVHTAQPLALLDGAAAAATGRTLELTLAEDGQGADPWPPAAAIVCDERERDGTVNFRIESDPHAGYLIWGPRYGRHRLSADGRHALCQPEGLAAAAWQRLLVAQVLPFAAVLRGLEVLHASAVVQADGDAAGGAVAFLGPSRSGKTSVALELVRRGAAFLADDVLAIERAGEQLLCHPGTPVAGLDHAEALRLQGSGGGYETIASNERERIVRMRGAVHPAPLRALFLLARHRDGPREPRFEPLAGSAPLLGGTFNSVIASPERLRGLLEICALAVRGRVERIELGPDVDASGLAEAVLQRLGSPNEPPAGQH